MTRDALDELLERSAPETSRLDPRDVDAMIAEVVRPAPHRRTARLALGAGVACALLLGGVGVAAATDGFAWAPWAKDPLGAVTFTMTTGLECELRFSGFSGGVDPGFVAEVNATLERWYRSTDVVAEARRVLPAVMADAGLTDIDLQPGETVEDLPPGEATHREWVRQWVAWDLAVSGLEAQELGRQGIAADDPRLAGSERNGQIQCFDESGAPYVAGAGR